MKVAKRLRENGDQTICNGAIIPYLICKNSNQIKTSYKVTDNAYHLKELKENKILSIDIEWYKSKQILASINRLCKHIKEIQPDILVESLGLDKKKYTIKDIQDEELILNEIDIIQNINSIIHNFDLYFVMFFVLF